MNIQAYSVAVRLSAKDDLTRVLKMASEDVLSLHKRMLGVCADLKNIDKYAKAATSSISAMSRAMTGNLSGATRDARQYSEAMRSATESTERLHRASSGLPGGNGASYLAIGAAAGLSGGGNNGGNRPPVGMLGLPGPADGGWKGWRNGVPPGGWGPGNPPGGGGGSDDGNGGGRNGAHRPLSDRDSGMTNLATGYVGYELLNSITEKGISYERELARLRQMGLNTAQINEAKAYVGTHNVANTSVLDRMRIFTDAQGSFRQSGMLTGDALAAAKTMMPVLAQYEVASQALSGQSQAAASTNMLNLNKIVEIMGGLNSPALAANIADGVFKASQSSGRIVNERQLKLFVAHGSTATNHQSLRAMFGALEPIIGEMGGDVASNGMLTAYNRINGNMSLIPKNLRREIARLGIGDATGTEQPKALAYLQTTDLPGYVKKMMGIYAAHGITNSIDWERENSILFGRGGAKIYNRMMAQIKTMDESLASYDRSHGSAATANDPDNHVIMARQAMGVAFENLQLALAQKGGVMENFTRGIDIVTRGVTTLTNAVDSHPNMARYAMDGAMAITALAGASGAMWVMKHSASALMGPLKFLAGKDGFPLLSTAIQGMPNIVALAAAAIGTELSVEIYRRFMAAKNGTPYDQLPTQTQEMAERDRLGKMNWEKSHPGMPYYGTRVWDLNSIPAKPGVSKASQFVPIPPKPSQPINIQVDSILDGKKIGQGMMTYLVKESTKAPSSVSAFDSSMILTHPGQVSGLSTK
ncbi:hypothetical protein [Serratia sp. M24T3]|uniref:hypothetical protein n=1 Tax=Serratia sp. M24T3 TaxID=932213 RepID=UPI00025BC0C1|nr:hypothetical protein [Serratia sp. M24T3]EIC82019.1 hypothetical protein SPM24T3_24047 [Serratia sp. M24T3]